MDQVLALAQQKRDLGFQNVAEAWCLHDTVIVSGYANYMKFHDGYFPTFLAFSGASQIPFFNVRNRNHHIAYNNQDTRDQMPYGFEAWSLGVDFWAPQIQTQLQDDDPDVVFSQHSSIWQCDVPRNCSITFRVNQDEIIKTQCAIAPPGMGPVGGGVSQGIQSTGISQNSGVGFDVIKGITSMGVPEITNRWKFPNPIRIPRRAAISAIVEPSQYLRELLAVMSGPWQYYLYDTDGNRVFRWTAFGITVSLWGKRLVQQRGRAHA